MRQAALRPAGLQAMAGPARIAKTSGSQTVTEPLVPANPSVTVTFGITCSLATSGLSGHTYTKIVVDQPPAKSGGGGAFELLTIAALLGTLVLRQRRCIAGWLLSELLGSARISDFCASRLEQQLT